MVEEGLDEEDQESLDYVADILQAESEVYFARKQAQDTGRYGFWSSGRQYQVQGSLTVEEKRARIQAIKAKTSCKKCGQTGHWADDAICPRNKGKGGKKGSSSSTTSTASTKGGKAHAHNGQGKGGGKPKGDKPRTVFFAIDEYGQGQRGGDSVQLSDGKVFAVRREHLGDHHGADEPTSTVMTSSRTADELLDEMIAEAHVQALQPHRQNQVIMDEHAALVSMGRVAPAGHSYRLSPERQNYLELYLNLVTTDPEWQDAYNERWSEMVPGHPLFTSNDADNLERWSQKAQLGLPRLPEHAMARVPEEDAEEWCRLEEERLDSLKEHASPGCEHKRTTRHGSNAYRKILKCLDCGNVLENVKRDETMPEGIDKEKCKHPTGTYRGSTATTWKWTCKSCGFTTSGHKKPGVNAKTASSASTPATTTSSSMPRSVVSADEEDMVEKIMQLFNHVVDMQTELGHAMTVEKLDKIYDKCKSRVVQNWRSSGSSRQMPSPYTQAPTTPSRSPTSSSVSDIGHGEMRFNSGVHVGRTFIDVYQNEKRYIKFVMGMYTAGTLKDENLKQFVRYAMAKQAGQMGQEDHEARALMVQNVEDEGETSVIAVLDTGCNNTCHGSRWMEKYCGVMNVSLEEEPADGKFRGVGGRVNVRCKRTIPLHMKTLDGEMIAGTLGSIELEDSDAPLLVSSKAQKKLGLVIDMGNNTAYSRTLDKELDVMDYNGLPAVRLHPGDAEIGCIALAAEHGEVEGDEDSSTEYTTDQRLLDYVEEELKEEDPVVETLIEQLPLREGEVKNLNKRQKKHLRESLADVEKEDCALWNTMRSSSRRSSRMMPRGCKTFLMELFAGAATLSMMAAHAGLPISQPVDVIYDARFDLLKKENRDRLEQVQRG